MKEKRTPPSEGSLTKGKQLPRRGTLFLIVSLSAVVVGGLALGRSPRLVPEHPATPDEGAQAGYLSSDGCRSCHPSEHSSWKQSYHSSMTRSARELGWTGEASPRLPVELELYSRRFRLSKQEGRIIYEGPDLHSIGRKLGAIQLQPETSQTWKRARGVELFATEAEVKKELVLITGSHHYLAFWIEGGDTKELRQLPFVYLLDEARFLPREEAFLQPPDALPYVARWNANCVQCHSVAGRPGQSEGVDKEGNFWERYDSSVAEQGIACEACHGPGQKHAQNMRSPLSRRQARRESHSVDVYLPDASSGVHGSETCGQCHSYFVPKNADEWWASGFSKSYRPGDPLEASRFVIAPDNSASPLGSEALDDGAAQALTLLSAHQQSLFWEDGSMIVGGREFNGLRLSPCFTQGRGEQQLGCTSCHSLHQGDPDGQIDPKKQGNTMCTQCHSDLPADHSRHRPDNAASLCTSCHMPRTSYALLQGLASHRIGSPALDFTSPPNACVLCHVDRDRSWFERELGAFGVTGTPTKAQTQDLPLAAELSLTQNAAERAIYAFALGTEEALTTAGSKVSQRLLPILMEDPYAAVRLIAERSLKKVKIYQQLAPQSAKPELSLERELADKLRGMRDDSPIVISE